MKTNYIYRVMFFFIAAFSTQGYEFFSKSTQEGTGIPENYEVRDRLKEHMFSALEYVHQSSARIFLQKTATHRVLFETRNQNNSVYFLFLNEKNNDYPISGIGNYIIKRSLSNGEFSQIKIFIRADAGCFLRIRPFGERVTLDLYLYDVPLHSEIILPVNFLSLITAPFAKIEELSSNIINWSSLLYKGNGIEFLEMVNIVDEIRNQLPTLRDAEDGATDRNGKFVFIESGSLQDEKGGLNCSGFAKWVVDGFYKPLTNAYLDIDQLKRKPRTYRGNRWSNRYEDSRDPYFGLDWSRNLAIYLEEARTGQKIVNPEIFDVRDLDFVPYIEDVGYEIGDLQLILYFLAIKNPGDFYIGSVNRDYGTNPILRQHFHLVLLFPYFDSHDKFHVVTMERNLETDLESLVNRFNKNHVHLIGIHSRGLFDLSL